MTSYDNINGREVPSLIITSDHVLVGIHNGTVQVESGHLELQGRIQGTLILHSGARATISGTQAGTVNVGHEANVVVTGEIERTTSVQRGGLVVVEPSGGLLARFTMMVASLCVEFSVALEAVQGNSFSRDKAMQSSQGFRTGFITTSGSGNMITDKRSRCAR